MAKLPLIRPMMATAGVLPAESEHDRWAFEMKWDGVRAVVYAGDGPLRILTRNDRDVAATYPELGGLGTAVARRVILDGEIVALAETGRPDFGVLQRRMHVQHPSRALLDAVPVSYLVFDVLHVGAAATLSQPYARRREQLESLDLTASRWDTPAVFLGTGEHALAASRSAGLEGVVAKRIDSVYEPGRRSPTWVKVKHQRMQEVVIGGWKAGEGRRRGSIGSLLIGVPGADGLAFAGHVGTGFTAAALDELAAMLAPLRRPSSPFATEVPPQHARAAAWVEPRLVGEVVFTEWTKDERLRHPSWRGLRPDKSSSDVVRES